MDRQVLFYDTRMSGFDRPPCIELGMRAASTQKITRYTRGSACHSFFVRPYGEGEGGLVRMWDYRNARVSDHCSIGSNFMPMSDTDKFTGCGSTLPLRASSSSCARRDVEFRHLCLRPPLGHNMEDYWRCRWELATFCE